jgi:hypothetical protein
MARGISEQLSDMQGSHFAELIHLHLSNFLKASVVVLPLPIRPIAV